jgi:IS30 family transposase
MDSVVGSRSGVGETLLVLTERKTRFELIFKVPSKESASTVSVLDYLQRRCAFRQIFKTITMDNGVEFANSRRLERDKSGRRRTYCFYCHPYTSCERGSNENNNRLIRRWFRKGQSLRNVTQGDAVRVARWMNNYPRAILGWKTATENFISCCEAEGIKISPYFSQFLS